MCKNVDTCVFHTIVVCDPCTTLPQWCSILDVARSAVVDHGMLDVLVPTRPIRLVCRSLLVTTGMQTPCQDTYVRMAAEGMRFPVTVQTPVGGIAYLHMRCVC